MITIKFFINGLLIGLTIAAIIGPIGLLCIQRTLKHGFKTGLLTGLGAATADGVYGLIAGAGLASLANLLLDYQGMIAGIGSLFLFWLAWTAYKTQPRELIIESETSEHTPEKLFQSFGSSFLLTISSPVTILSFAAIFAGFGIVGEAQGVQDALYLVLGIFLGSMLWWVILCGIVQTIRKKISAKMISKINKACGILLSCFAIYAFIKAVMFVLA